MTKLPADLEALMPEPTAWTLTQELQRRETTCKAHMWFVNPQNSSWEQLFTADQMREAILAATERAAKLERQSVQAALRHAGLTLVRTEHGLQVMAAIIDAQAEAAAIRARTGGGQT